MTTPTSASLPPRPLRPGQGEPTVRHPQPLAKGLHPPPHTSGSTQDQERGPLLQKENCSSQIFIWHLAEQLGVGGEGST